MSSFSPVMYFYNPCVVLFNDTMFQVCSVLLPRPGQTRQSERCVLCSERGYLLRWTPCRLPIFPSSPCRARQQLTQLRPCTRDRVYFGGGSYRPSTYTRISTLQLYGTRRSDSSCCSLHLHRGRCGVAPVDARGS